MGPKLVGTTNLNDFLVQHRKSKLRFCFALGRIIADGRRTVHAREKVQIFLFSGFAWSSRAIVFSRLRCGMHVVRLG